jgi:hypothetical protein
MALLMDGLRAAIGRGELAEYAKHLMAGVAPYP